MGKGIEIGAFIAITGLAAMAGFKFSDVVDAGAAAKVFLEGDEGEALLSERIEDALQKSPPIAPVSPVGTVVAWPGEEVGIPNGWHACDGSTITKADYGGSPEAWNDLWRALSKGEADRNDPLGLLYKNVARGSLEGVTQIHLPDFRGYFLRGAEDNPGDRDWGAFVKRHGSIGYNHPEGLERTEIGDENGKLDLYVSHEAFTVDGVHLVPRNYAVHWIIRVK